MAGDHAHHADHAGHAQRDHAGHSRATRTVLDRYKHQTQHHAHHSQHHQHLPKVSSATTSSRTNTTAATVMPLLSLALEITGHVHRVDDLIAATRGKMDVVAAAAAAKWTVDVFCVLSADSNATLVRLRRAVDRFEGELRRHAGVVNCTLDPFGESIYESGTTTSPRPLRPQHRGFHPAYPYLRRNDTLGPGRGGWLARVQNSLSMFEKFWRVGELRRSSLRGANPTRRPHDIVWRSRPDAAATLPLEAVRRLVDSPTGYLVPGAPMVAAGIPTDMEAILPGASGAADRFDAIWRNLAQLERSGVAFHPESLVAGNMRAAGFAFQASDEMVLHSCTHRPAVKNSPRLVRPEWPCLLGNSGKMW
tara:strand:+ start:1029 stop:2117 length:1089 start_codon:yes stop_codon:yes gene_type:complete